MSKGMRSSLIILFFIICFISISCVIYCASCDRDKCGNVAVKNNGRIISKTFSLYSFYGVSSMISGDINISQGEVQKVVVKGDESVINQLRLEVDDFTLKIGMSKKKNRYYGKEKLSFDITIPKLENITLFSSSNIKFGPFHNAKELAVTIMGSGDIVRTKDDVTTLDHFDLSITGSGSYRGYNIKAKEADISIKGSGSAKIHVIDELDVSILGSGDIMYRGNPKIDQSIRGSGNVLNKN